MPRRPQRGVPETVADATAGAVAHPVRRRRRKRWAESKGTDPDGACAPDYQARPIVSEYQEKGRGLGEKGKGNGEGNGPCYHFLNGKSQRGSGCKFFHPVGKEGIAKLKLEEGFVVWRAVGARRDERSIGESSVAEVVRP